MTDSQRVTWTAFAVPAMFFWSGPLGWVSKITLAFKGSTWYWNWHDKKERSDRIQINFSKEKTFQCSYVDCARFIVKFSLMRITCIIIGPESDLCLALSVTDWLTDWLLFSKLSWWDPGVWRCQLNTCWGCYCWCRETCWQQFSADLEAEVLASK